MSVEFLKSDFEKISYLQNMLVAHATGGSAESSEYETLRHELLSNKSITSKLPSWLKTHRNLDSFWGFIQPKLASYRERRAFLAEEFAPVLNYLEFGEEPTAEEHPTPPIVEPQVINNTAQPKSKVFIVHGHDNESKQEVSRFIESLGLDVIILHEQASSGMTIIEKIEHYSKEADFAVVLYTACDHGRGVHEDTDQYRNRARQNVVFEHGYLMAKIGRKHVCALVKGEIETPNDISGVVYVPLDVSGGWKMEIVKELKACGYTLTY
ncbi:nucleotide-binding protein [Candidatus Peregrinibacteria bacterium]|nr:nucleotide-binding protein [Candidatus Peregrinibacteria bacterium]MBT7590077.1 nucleotide-binding protein [Candidatus Scalindua sp.]